MRPSVAASRSRQNDSTRAVTATRLSPPGGAKFGSASHAQPALGAHLGQRAAVPLAVVELDQPVVDLDRATAHLGDRGRRLPGPLQRTRDQRGDRLPGETGREARGLIEALLGQLEIDAPLQAAVAVVRGLAVANERDHRRSPPSIASRPVCQKARRRTGSARPNRVQVHQAAARPSSLLEEQHGQRRAATPPADARFRRPATRTPACASTCRRARGS